LEAEYAGKILVGKKNPGEVVKIAIKIALSSKNPSHLNSNARPTECPKKREVSNPIQQRSGHPPI
jgi:hypothetical protein